MGKNKLKKFAEMETLPCVYQYPFAHLKETGGCRCAAAGAGRCFTTMRL